MERETILRQETVVAVPMQTTDGASLFLARGAVWSPILLSLVSVLGSSTVLMCSSCPGPGDRQRNRVCSSPALPDVLRRWGCAYSALSMGRCGAAAGAQRWFPTVSRDGSHLLWCSVKALGCWYTMWKRATCIEIFVKGSMLDNCLSCADELGERLKQRESLNHGNRVLLFWIIPFLTIRGVCYAIVDFWRSVLGNTEEISNLL